MPYSPSIREEELKLIVSRDIFGAFDCTRILDCLVYTLFHGQNRISCTAGKFTAAENAKDAKDSGEALRPLRSLRQNENSAPLRCVENPGSPSQGLLFGTLVGRFVEASLPGKVDSSGRDAPTARPQSDGSGTLGFGEERGDRRNPEAEHHASHEIGLRAESEEGKALRPVPTSDAKQTPLPLRLAETPRFQSLAGELPATLGARTSRNESVQYAYEEADAVFPGLVLTYHFGFGTDPLDPADFTPRDTVEVSIEFGDDSGSHSEKYEVTLAPYTATRAPR